MNRLTRIAKWTCIAAVAMWILTAVFLVRIEPGQVGVRQSNFSGVLEEDLEPGWHWRIPLVHKITRLPSHFLFLDYTSDAVGRQQPLQIRTTDNNIVQLEVSVPIHVLRDNAHEIVKAGNHSVDSDGHFRFWRLAEDTTVSVLREHLAELTSVGFYTTGRRLEISASTLEVLNESLALLQLEAESVLIRAVKYRPEYENQLQQIQLNEQNKLLDRARERVALEQQELDNYLQGTRAMATAREQDWKKRQANLERAYEVGFVASEGINTPGAVRRALAAVDDGGRAALRTQASAVFDFEDDDKLAEHYLIGIKNIEAETLEYRQRLFAEANGIGARLTAEGDARVAKVRGQFESKVNALLNSPAGRAYVAWKSAANVAFAKTLTFNSSDGIPSILRLREFALQFMGR